MGALIGGIYAAGELDSFAQWASALTRRDVMRLLDWSFSQGAIFKGERIIDELRKLVGERDIETLDIGFTAVATDLNSGREVWFSKGPLWNAIRASIAVPLVFAPVEHAGRLLVDGGLVNPVPIAPTFNSHAPLTFAVDLNGSREGGVDRHGRSDGGESEGEPAASDESTLSSLRSKIKLYIDKISADLPTVEWRVPQAFELALRSMDTMQTTISRMKLAAYSPQLIITVPGNLATFFEFHRAQEMIDCGYRATETALRREGY
jgi:NTE family protein